MNELTGNMEPVFGLIGFLVVVFCCVVGGYVTFRWGFTGVAVIWQRRRELDNHVEDEVVEVTGKGPRI